MKQRKRLVHARGFSYPVARLHAVTCDVAFAGVEASHTCLVGAKTYKSTYFYYLLVVFFFVFSDSFINHACVSTNTRFS